MTLSPEQFDKLAKKEDLLPLFAIIDSLNKKISQALERWEKLFPGITTNRSR